MLKYADYLERQWKIGQEANDELDGRAEKSDGEDYDMVDLVNSGSHVVMRGSRTLGR